ncbi:aminotransferase class V-fold PLP-dependent enzyme [Marivirga sp. S37H4]|uniref:Aminotransferase class V-fold PLP-dependent enzyme n=1 Tax=Marivirga aurantiaca TaxID=2802615 RepID=A0A934WVD6_9BACT|nr:aminotransferase class V-fold PLP-dependent enzyme [Marivirga aurantiaca]MBK6263644.1 aminotransferase class V-fold PLP-dependent enzyme [Marivirga aurantiaca]
MINFYPGPSKLYPEIGTYLQEAFQSGILEMNHRSEAFMELYASTKNLLKEKLNIPEDYEIVLVSSATECWEIISQSFVEKASVHLFNGAFGEKWFDYAKKIHSASSAVCFEAHELPVMQEMPKAELLALTHNETSNGTALPDSFQVQLRKEFSHSLIAYDATSSMAGYNLQWKNGDIWFASVQKCFGLPPGLAIMVVSPEAVDRAAFIKDDRYYNSFNYILGNARKNQTHHTPNISNIYLLKSTLRQRADIENIHQDLMERKLHFFEEMKQFPQLQNYILSSDQQSDTVFCLRAEEPAIVKLKNATKENGILLGNGYGSLKNTTFRIANFPALLQADFDRLLLFFAHFFK